MIIFKPQESMILKYWKKVEMKDKQRNDKGDYVATGKMVEMTGYSFFNEFGEELYFISPKNDFRDYEGKQVMISVKASYDDYGRKNKFVLDQVDLVK